MDDITVSRPADNIRNGYQTAKAGTEPEYIPLNIELDKRSLKRFFPMPTYRPGQKEAIESILNAFNSGKKVVLVEAPTGSGKSAIAYAVAQYFRYSYWLTIQKILQDQIIGDFGENGKYTKTTPVIDLKGRNAYPCNFWERSIIGAKGENSYGEWTAEKKKIYSDLSSGVGCESGYCKRNGRSKENFCFPGPKAEFNLERINGIYSYCPYWNRKAEALTASICLMNFSSFLYQTRAVRSFGQRDLMIVDEAHQAESQLMSFIEFTISDRHFRQQGIVFPKKDIPLEYAEYFLEIQLDQLIENKIKLAKAEQDAKMEDEWKQILLKYSIFITSSDSDNWVLEFKESSGRLLGKKKTVQNTVILKPIFVNEYAKKYMFSMADKVLMMSATILSPKIVCRSLGLDSDDVYSFRMKNRFPIENRKIIFDPCGSLNVRNKKETFPKLVKKIEEICSDPHEDQRGIIHTHNFEIARLLMDECDRKIADRFLFQEEWNNKNEMLEYHKNSKNTIIVAPAMHEGLDLKDDLARFAIICKVPYPSMVDPQIKARMERQGSYYDFLTALKLVQSYGRTIRSDDDWSITYIVDGGFEKFFRRAQKLMPGWFKEAVS